MKGGPNKSTFNGQLTYRQAHRAFSSTHTAKSPPGPWHPFDPSIRDLGPVPLSTVCTPYYETYLVLIIQAAAADWT